MSEPEKSEDAEALRRLLDNLPEPEPEPVVVKVAAPVEVGAGVEAIAPIDVPAPPREVPLERSPLEKFGIFLHRTDAFGTILYLWPVFYAVAFIAGLLIDRAGYYPRTGILPGVLSWGWGIGGIVSVLSIIGIIFFGWKERYMNDAPEYQDENRDVERALLSWMYEYRSLDRQQDEIWRRLVTDDYRHGERQRNLPEHDKTGRISMLRRQKRLRKGIGFYVQLLSSGERRAEALEFLQTEAAKVRKRKVRGSSTLYGEK